LATAFRSQCFAKIRMSIPKAACRLGVDNACLVVFPVDEFGLIV